MKTASQAADFYGHGDTNKPSGRFSFKSCHFPSDQRMSDSLQQKPSTGEFLSSSQVACLQVPWAASLLKQWHRGSNRAELVHRLCVIWIFGPLFPTNQKLPHPTSSLLRTVPSQRVLKHDTWVRNICHLCI